MKKSFTILELLIIVALISILATAAIYFFNPFQQIHKAQDAKRKNDLDKLKKAFEDYYNDKGCYPKPSEVCYDEPINLCTGVGSNKKINNQICHICGNESDSPSFTPYLSKLPCDPTHPSKKYLYQVEGDTSISCSLSTEKACPQRYKIFSQFGSVSDKASDDLGCTLKGCGPARPAPPLPSVPYGYDYGVSSPNIAIKGSSSYTCYNITCQMCNTYARCMDPDISPGCVGRPLYSSCQACQIAHGGNPGACPFANSYDF